MADIFIHNTIGIKVTKRSSKLESKPYDIIKITIETSKGEDIINIIGKDNIKLEDLGIREVEDDS